MHVKLIKLDCRMHL